MRAAFDDDRRISTATDPGDELIAASHANATDRVMIAGAEQLALLTTLIRRGYLNVACQSAERGPHAPMPETDVLLVPRVRCESELLSILHHLGRALRPRGTLVLQVAEPLRADEKRLRRLVMEAGFTALERIPGDMGSEPLWCARKHAETTARAA